MQISKLADILSNKNVSGYYDTYLKTQWYSEEEMKFYQLKKLQNLVHHCYNNVPYYTKYMKNINLRPEDITSVDQISFFPIITKEIIKENYDFFIPNNIKQIKGVKTSQTGGTTGNILFKRNDANTRSSAWATYKRFTNDWMGVGDNSKKLILMGGHVLGSTLAERLKVQLINLLYNQTVFSPYDTSIQNIDRIINALNNDKFEQIRSYSQFLFQLALKLKDKNLNYHIKSITTTAEPLTMEHRKLFKEVFNAEVFDQYGCGEIGGIAYECDHHQGLHISEEKVLVEVNDNKELIVTDLDNFAMPFIRYWNADQATISLNKCSCGRKSKIIKEIMGRTCDYIIGLNGQILHWAYFWHLFFDSQVAKNRNLKKFQVVQEDRYNLKIRLVCDELSENEKKILNDNIFIRLGSLNIKYSFEDEIENSPSGKYRPVVNLLI